MVEVELIEDEDELYRRLVAYYVKPDGTVSAAAYKNHRRLPQDSISVDLGRLTTPEETIARASPGFRLGGILARVPRGVGLEVTHDPLPDNPAHSLIRGENTMAIRRELAEATRVVL